MDDYRSRIYQRYASRFQDAAPRFDEHEASRWGRAYRKYLRGWLPQDPNAAILDVGCGGGKLLYLLGQLGYRNLTGVDISPEQVALARQVCAGVVEANAIEFLKCRDDHYDFIIGLDIVEHFKKDEVLSFLDLCHDSLKSGGRLILQTPNADNPFGLGIRYGDFTHEVAFSPNSLTRLVALAGFEAAECREAGPVAHGICSAIRLAVWRLIRVGILARNVVETGGVGSGVLTRVFIVSAVHSDAGSSLKGDSADE